MKTMKDLIGKGLENDVEAILKIENKNVSIKGELSAIQCIIFASSLIIAASKNFDKEKVLTITKLIVENNIGEQKE